MSLGMPEILIVLVVVVLLFGPSRIPKLGRAVGDTVRALRGARKDLDEIQREEISEE